MLRRPPGVDHGAACPGGQQVREMFCLVTDLTDIAEYPRAGTRRTL